MVSGGPERRGNIPERGEEGGLCAPDSCYLDGKNIQAALSLLCPRRDVVAAGDRGWRRGVCCRALHMTEAQPYEGRCTLRQLSAVILVHHPLSHGTTTRAS